MSHLPLYFLHPQVIYELTQGEKQLIEDLSLVKKVCPEFNRFVFMGWIYIIDFNFNCPRQVYYEPMLKLDIMTESELGQIFGTLDSLIPLHEGKCQ